MIFVTNPNPSSKNRKWTKNEKENKNKMDKRNKNQVPLQQS